MRKILICFALLIFTMGFAHTVSAAEIDFNKATAEELVKVTDGLVDTGLARAIVDHRTANGPFKSPADVKAVPGMKTVIFNSLGLKKIGDDIIYSTEVEPGMKAY